MSALIVFASTKHYIVYKAYQCKPQGTKQSITPASAWGPLLRWMRSSTPHRSSAESPRSRRSRGVGTAVGQRRRHFFFPAGPNSAVLPNRLTYKDVVPMWVAVSPHRHGNLDMPGTWFGCAWDVIKWLHILRGTLESAQAVVTVPRLVRASQWQ